MRILVDENLSPELVAVGHDHGYDTTCARDRGLLGQPDHRILAVCVEEDRVVVTNDADDFRGLVGRIEVHPGLIVIPNLDRSSQLRLFATALAFVEQQAGSGKATRDFMVNRVVEVDDDGGCEAHVLPACK